MRACKRLIIAALAATVWAAPAMASEPEPMTAAAYAALMQACGVRVAGTCVIEADLDIVGVNIDLGNVTLTATSAQMAAALSDETGSGALMFGTSPTFATSLLGADNAKIVLGSGSDAEIYYDGTNLVIDPDAVGAGVLSVGGNLVVSGTGPHAFGGAVVDYTYLKMGGAFTSGGSNTYAALVDIQPTLTAANGDTSWLTSVAIRPAITTQSNSETIGVVSTLRIDEPAITKGTDIITAAATAYIAGAPTEGSINAALLIASGNLAFGDGDSFIYEPSDDRLDIWLGGVATTALLAANYARFYDKIQHWGDGDDSQYLELISDDDVAAGTYLTSDDGAFFMIMKESATAGGARLYGQADGTAVAMKLMAHGGSNTTDTTKSTAGWGLLTVDTADSATSSIWNGVVANGNLLVIQNASSTRWIVDAEGDTYRDGTDNTFALGVAMEDGQPHLSDGAALVAWEHSQTPYSFLAAALPVSVAAAEAALERAGILAPVDPQTGRRFYNESALLRLAAGAASKNWMALESLRSEIGSLRAQVVALTARLAYDQPRAKLAAQGGYR